MQKERLDVRLNFKIEKDRAARLEIFQCSPTPTIKYSVQLCHMDTRYVKPARCFKRAKLKRDSPIPKFTQLTWSTLGGSLAMPSTSD